MFKVIFSFEKKKKKSRERGREWELGETDGC